MGGILKFFTGLCLFVAGILITYATVVCNFLDIFLVIGFILVICGIIIIIKYFVDTSASQTRDLINDLLNSNSIKGATKINNRNLFTSKKSNIDDSQGPLWVRSNNDDYYNNELEELNIEDYERVAEEDSYLERANKYSYDYSNANTVLNVVDQPSEDVNFGNTLNFTPNYDKPLKVTRRPKKRDESFFDDKYIYYGETNDKTEEIKKALHDDEPIIIPQHIKNKVSSSKNIEPREITIDVNNPESLPVPKILKSFIVSNNGILTSQESFEILITNVSKEIMFQIPSLTDLSEKIISYIPSIYSRLLIEEFSMKDIANVMLVSSLINQGVHIRTIPKVNSINLVTDDSHALIISNCSDLNDIEYGAIYEDRDSISEIRSSFETIWNIAKEIDINDFLEGDSDGA